ncbi:MAG: hypothetical protein EOP07_10560 [Proteobacteria bacterium]|nr:MAG: hypothetical protein EOP07_10560 [Pseudomonadota bacterium]
MFRVTCLMLVLSQLGCNSQSSDFNKRAETGSKDGAGQTGAPGSTTGGAVITPPGTGEIVIIEPAPATNPVIIAGASLSCSLSTDDKYLGCQIATSSNSFLEVPSDIKLVWTVTTLTDVTVIENVATHAVPGKETYFFVPFNRTLTKSIVLKMAKNALLQTLEFKMDQLPKINGSYVQQSIPVANNLQSPTIYQTFALLYSLGDGSVAKENDNCPAEIKTAARITEAQTTQIWTNHGPSNIYLGGICGLENNWTYMTISGTAPQRDVYVKLTPGASNLLLAKNFDVNGSPITFKVGLSENHSQDQALDDFDLQYLLFELSTP